MKKLGYVLVIILLLLLPSCTSIKNAIQADLEDVPIWIIKQPTRKNMQYFIGQGKGETLKEAENNAHQNLLDNVSLYLGQDISEQFYRQFTLNDSVVELDLIIERTEERVSQDSFAVYFLASAITTTLDKFRSDEFKAILHAENNIERLLAEALEAFKENKDILTIEKYLEAVELALTNDIQKEEYKADILLEKATEYLSNITLTLSRAKPDLGSVSVRVRRSRFLLDSPIVDSNVKAYFTLHDHRNSFVEVSNVFLTNIEGYVHFVPVNKNMTREGIVHFFIDIDESITRIEKIAPLGYMDEFKALLESKAASFEYKIPSRLANTTLLVFIAEFDIDGNKLPTTLVQDTMLSYVASEGVSVNLVTSAEEEDEFIIEDIQMNYPEAKYLLMGRAGEVDFFDEGEEIFLLIEGHISLIDLQTGQIIDEDITSSVFARGKTREDARVYGFLRYADVFASGFFHNL